MSETERDANAAHIVKCVNVHDELVEMAKLHLQDYDNRFPYDLSLDEEEFVEKLRNLLKRID